MRSIILFSALLGLLTTAPTTSEANTCTQFVRKFNSIYFYNRCSVTVNVAYCWASNSSCHCSNGYRCLSTIEPREERTIVQGNGDIRMAECKAPFAPDASGKECR